MSISRRRRRRFGEQSAAEFARRQQQDFYYFVVQSLFTETKSHLFPKHSARELLFDGYEDPILSEGEGVIDIPFDRFGWFYKRNGSSSDGLFEMKTGAGEIASLGRLVSWNREQRLPFPGSCGSLDGVSAGDLYPAYQESVERIKMFVGEICRPLALPFAGLVDHAGVSARRFSFDGSTFDYSREENRCFCSEDGGSCPADGVANVSACVFNSPAAVSLPHFLHADPVYRQRVGGLRPDPSVHAFTIDVMPQLGVPVFVQAAMMVSVVLTRDERLSFTNQTLERQTFYPAFYFITNATVTQDMAAPMRLLQLLDHWISIAGLVMESLGVLLLFALLFSLRHQLPAAKLLCPPAAARSRGESGSATLISS